MTMSNIDPTTTKYVITARLTAEGIIEKPDVVGAIFGQTEGLLGEDLDLRELQKTGRMGRIEVAVVSKRGRSEGTVTLPSSLDKVETAILAASLETIDRVGPCKAQILVSSVEDVRVQKKTQVIERAKELLGRLSESDKDGGLDIIEEVRESIQVAEITSFGPERLPAGPNVATSNAIIIVEGRSDVLALLKCGIKNVIAVEGTNVPESVKKLCEDKLVTAFLDGDRGGELILRELFQTCDVDFVATAPRNREVEEMSAKQIMKALKAKVPADAYRDQHGIAGSGGSAAGAPGGAGAEGVPRGGGGPRREGAEARGGRDGGDGRGRGPDQARGGRDGGDRGRDGRGGQDRAGRRDDRDSRGREGTDSRGREGTGESRGREPGDDGRGREAEPASASAVPSDSDSPPAAGPVFETPREEPQVVAGASEGVGAEIDSAPARPRSRLFGSLVDRVSGQRKVRRELTPAQKHYLEHLGTLSGTFKAQMLGADGRVLSEVPVRELREVLKEPPAGTVAVVFDGVVTQPLLDTSVEKGIGTLVGLKVGPNTKQPAGVDVLTKADEA